jgi:hypothetical protein
MKSLSEVLEELRSLATEQTKKTYLRHGAPENCLGVKIGDIKPIAGSVRGCQALALELYDSGIPDALSYIEKVEARGAIGKKKKTIK